MEYRWSLSSYWLLNVSGKVLTFCASGLVWRGRRSCCSVAVSERHRPSGSPYRIRRFGIGSHYCQAFGIFQNLWYLDPGFASLKRTCTGKRFLTKDTYEPSPSSSMSTHYLTLFLLWSNTASSLCFYPLAPSLSHPGVRRLQRCTLGLIHIISLEVPRFSGAVNVFLQPDSYA